MRQVFDKFFSFGLYAAAFLNAAALVTILINIIMRIFGRSFNGADAYSGYFIAGSFFLAMAATYRKGEHIRVSILISNAKNGLKRIVDIWCLSIASLLTGYFSYFTIKMVYFSYKFKELSQGIDATPIWIPQLGMALGVVILTLALVEDLFTVIAGGEVVYNKDQNEEISYVD